ncbi:MAG: APC family permease [Elainellaceae cyanobacterium]
MTDLSPQPLSSRIRFWRLIWTGLSAIVGAGALIGLGIAAGVAGPYLLVALGLGAATAFCHGLSWIQLVVYHQTIRHQANYDTLDRAPLDAHFYGYSDGLLNPWLGFTAAWGLALSQAAIAAATALGLAGYALSTLQASSPIGFLLLALGSIALLTGLELKGWQYSRWLQLGLTLVTLGVLGVFIGSGALYLAQSEMQAFQFSFDPLANSDQSTQPPLFASLEAAGLIAVAYAGYGQIIRTNEVPQTARRTLISLILLLVLAFLLYGGVALVAIGTVGGAALGDAAEAFAAPLNAATRQFASPKIMLLVAVGATLILFNILHHLLSELAQILWSMSCRRDLPKVLARLHPITVTPTRAILTAGIAVAGLSLLGDLYAIWTFGAFAFLSYMAIMHLAVLRLSPAARLYPQGVAWLGLTASGLLILGLESKIWLTGLGLMVTGLIWRGINLWVAEHAD